jgi:CelD/BcsL family acetyltransferase involved in cellulose biosynthesis
MLTLERIELNDCDWERMDAYADRVIFQTREWVEFVARTQRADPVVAAVLDDGDVVGHFTGLIVRRWGIQILGSPFPGWTTSSMGFNLREGVSRPAAADALVRFAFGPLRCAHMELKDRLLAPGDLAGRGFASTPNLTFEIDLEGEESDIFARMSSACRRAIRKGEKVGVRVERAHGLAFADEYYEQLEAVFARQSLAPTYPLERVRTLIECLEPTGRLLLLRALSPDDRPIATGIFPAFNRTAYFWGGASWREDQILRPNEAVFWHAMRYWREQGMSTFDMGGGGDYKRRYGPRELYVPFFRRSRVPGLSHMRALARAATAGRQMWRGRRKSGARPVSNPSDRS